MRASRADSVNTFHPDITIASARSWTASFQRALSRNTAIDIRYVGTRGVNQWTEIDYNGDEDLNIVENGFLNEFRLAMANLQANNAAGGDRVGSFKYFGPGTGTEPAADLSGPLQRVHGRQQSDRLLGHELDQYDVRGAPQSPQSGSRQRG